jgi:hypothetical protein
MFLDVVDKNFSKILMNDWVHPNLVYSGLSKITPSINSYPVISNSLSILITLSFLSVR